MSGWVGVCVCVGACECVSFYIKQIIKNVIIKANKILWPYAAVLEILLFFYVSFFFQFSPLAAKLIAPFSECKFFKKVNFLPGYPLT